MKVDYIRSYLHRDETEGHVNGEVAYSYTVEPGQPVPESLPQAPSANRMSNASLDANRAARSPGRRLTEAEAATRAAGAPSGERGGPAGQSLDLFVPDHPVDVILGRPTQDSVTVSVLAYQDSEGFIEFGTRQGIHPDKTPLYPLSNSQPAEVLIDSLQPDTQYYYQLFYRTGSAGEFTSAGERTFHTQRAPGSTFTFTVQADSHLDSNSSTEVYERMLANVLADRPDFHIDLGDTFMTDKYHPYTESKKQYLAQRYYLSLVGHSTLLFLVLGNHDGERGDFVKRAVDSMPVWSAQLRNRYFPNPVPDDFYLGNLTPHEAVGLLQDYYAWEWGNALLAMLDPYWFTTAPNSSTDNWSRTLGSAQYQWLKTTLEGSQATLKFVFIHTRNRDLRTMLLITKSKKVLRF